MQSVTFFIERIYNLFRTGKLAKKYTYRPNPSLNKLFSKTLLNVVSWNSGKGTDHKSELKDSSSYQAWKLHRGGHKWLHYFPIYDQIFKPYFTKPVRILEIGIYQGASIKMLSELFPKKIKYVGIDIDQNCKKYENKDEQIFVEIGSQADSTFLEKLVEKHGPFDIIIDDGSHISSHMIASFNVLFENGLSERGIYFVEDTHTSYWRDYRDTPYSFTDFAKHCVEQMGIHYAKCQFKDFQIEHATDKSVSNITTMIQEIRFFDSIIVFQKTKKKSAPIVLHH